jgi:hypothetical protein
MNDLVFCPEVTELVMLHQLCHHSNSCPKFMPKKYKTAEE